MKVTFLFVYIFVVVAFAPSTLKLRTHETVESSDHPMKAFKSSRKDIL